jgi:glycosyltransferase involved in cell wall biosynthesis
MRSPSISVVICVYTEDRWDQIRAAVDSVRAQTLPSAETIIVVDHNPELYKRLIAAVPDAMVVENRETKGLSGGRNTGSALAQGEIIAFLDDDAVADPDWLKYLAEDYANPSVMGVGGLTLPNWQTARPSWLPEEFYWVIGCNYKGMPPSNTPVRNLLGVNMSFRREVFELVDGFQSGIGRNTDTLPLGCEETLFCITHGQRSPGSLLIMDHRAKVWHYVSDGRCRFSYFVSRCYAEGISKAQVTSNVGSGDGLSTERSYTTRTLPLGVVAGIADLFRGDSGGLGRAGAIVTGLSAAAAGYLKARLEQAHRRQVRQPDFSP